MVNINGKPFHPKVFVFSIDPDKVKVNDKCFKICVKYAKAKLSEAFQKDGMEIDGKIGMQIEHDPNSFNEIVKLYAAGLPKGWKKDKNVRKRKR